MPSNYNAVYDKSLWGLPNVVSGTGSANVEEAWELMYSTDYYRKTLTIKTENTWDETGLTWDAVGKTWDGNCKTGSNIYTFGANNEIDLGSEQTAPVFIDYSLHNIDGGSLVIEMATKGATGDWGDWAVYSSGKYTFRYLKFRFTFETIDPGYNVWIFDFSVEVDVEDVLDKGTATITDAGSGVVVTYNVAYTTTPRITVSTRGTSPYNPLITASSANSFTVKLRDPETTTYKTGTVDWHSVGY